MQADSIKEKIKEILVREIPSMDEPLGFDTPLISSKMIDSFHTMMIVKALEDEFKCRFSAFEVSETYLDTINKISVLIESKVKSRA